MNLQLSQSQTDAVAAPWKNTVSLVLSTAGSGKTLALTCRAVRIAIELAQENTYNSRVLCICFNVSAAEEMAERITDLVIAKGFDDRVIVTRKQFQPKDMVAIEVRTFHALGYWIIRSANDQERESVGLRQGTIKLLSGKNHRDIIIEALEEAGELDPSTNKRYKNSRAHYFEKIFGRHKRMVLERECEQDLSQQGEQSLSQETRHMEGRHAFELYLQRMKGQNSITYDDMIGKPIALLKSAQRLHEKIGSRYAAVLVDEFQDLTPAEFVMCKALVDNSKALTMVGDDDQQIYSFRSSRSWFCHEMVDKWFTENLQVLQLPENRRCPGSVVKSATAVINQNSRRASKDIVAVHPSGMPVRIVGCKDRRLEIRFVINRIKSLLPTVQRNKEQILVLFRINELLNLFQKSLRMAGVATSRVLVEPGRADSIGSMTSATFALICLMSKSVDRATFVWAAVTLVSALDREFIESILLTAETQEQVKPADISDTVEKTEAQGGKALETGEDKDTEPSLSEKPFPSRYVDHLRAWYESNRKMDMDIKLRTRSENLHLLLDKTERLFLKLRNLNTAEKLVRSAVEVISANSSGEYEDYPEYSASQMEDAPSQTVADGKAGFDLLISAARRIDEKAGDDDEEGEDKRDIAASNSKGAVEGIVDDDDEYFQTLFGMDEKSRRKKRKKLAPNVDSHSGTVLERRRRLGKKIEELCEVLEVTLTKSDRSGSNKVSCTERPATVLSTIHKAKGTSFAYVFLCGANLHNLPNGAQHELDMCGSIAENSEKNEEERRLFFVSLTRTMKEFTCTYSSPDNALAGHPSSWRSIFIKELLDNLEGEGQFATELFVEADKDIATVVKTLQNTSVTTGSMPQSNPAIDVTEATPPFAPGSPLASF